MNNKKKNNHGFTIVELVIVIAVIAILAGVMIPTFGGIIEQAEASQSMQDARNEYTTYLTYHPEAADDYSYVKNGDVYYDLKNDFKVETDSSKYSGAKIYEVGECVEAHEGKTCDVCKGAGSTAHTYDPTSKECSCGAKES